MLVNNSKPVIKLIFNAKRLNIHTPFKSNSRIPSSMGVSEIQNMGGLTHKSTMFSAIFNIVDRIEVLYHIHRVNLINNFMYANKMKINMQSKKKIYV